MAFSFLKKGSKEKQKPLPSSSHDEEPQPPLPREAEVLLPQQKKAPKAATPEDDSQPSEDLGDFSFHESISDFYVEQETDPVIFFAEEAAVLFANGQDDEARMQLEHAVHEHQTPQSERLWFMLFDLYRLMGEKAAFETSGITYASVFEKSPPIWKEKFTRPAKTESAIASRILFKGELVGENRSAFDSLRLSVEKSAQIKIDLSHLKQIDPQGCQNMLDLIHLAQTRRHVIEIQGKDILAQLIEPGIETGKAENPQYWLLLFEIYQQLGRQDDFEEMAINYAITFEVSPPSWEQQKIVSPEPLQSAIQESPDEKIIGAYLLKGNIKASRFEELQAHADKHKSLIIDCSALLRMDFISAGVLLNLLTGIKQEGKPIRFLHLNHLVAELFVVIGLTAIANVEYAKN